MTNKQNNWKVSLLDKDKIRLDNYTAKLIDVIQSHKFPNGMIDIEKAVPEFKQGLEYIIALAKQQTLQEVEEKIDGRLEHYAHLEHERWAKWQRYVHSKLEYVEYAQDGKTFAGYILDADDYEHWERQIDTDYTELSDREKDSDRAQVKPYIDDMKQLLLAIK